MTLALKNSLVHFHAQSRCFSTHSHTITQAFKSARRLIHRGTNNPNALRRLQRDTDEPVNVKTYVFNRAERFLTGKLTDLIAFPALSVPDRRRPHGSDTWPSPKLMDCRKNWCHTKHPPDLTDPCLLTFALWTLETILNGFRRLSGVTLPTCSTRVKANLQRYCASQHSFLTSEVAPSLSSLLHKSKI